MNWPKLEPEMETDTPTEYGRRIKSSAFFREPDFAETPVRIDLPSLTAAKCRRRRLSVLFRDNRDGKLMHKIHRLTDN